MAGPIVSTTASMLTTLEGSSLNELQASVKALNQGFEKKGLLLRNDANTAGAAILGTELDSQRLHGQALALQERCSTLGRSRFS